MANQSWLLYQGDFLNDICQQNNNKMKNDNNNNNNYLGRQEEQKVAIFRMTIEANTKSSRVACVVCSQMKSNYIDVYSFNNSDAVFSGHGVVQALSIFRVGDSPLGDYYFVTVSSSPSAHVLAHYIGLLCVKRPSLPPINKYILRGGSGERGMVGGRWWVVSGRETKQASKQASEQNKKSQKLNRVEIVHFRSVVLSRFKNNG